MADNHGQHIVPFDAMRFLDEEMSATESLVLQLHLCECERCNTLLFQTRERLSQMPGIIYSDNPLPDLRENDIAARLLQDRLAEISGGKPNTAWHQKILHGHASYVGYASVILFAAISLSAIGHWQLMHEAGQKSVALLPDKNLTPGAIRPVSLTELCSTVDGDDDLDPTVAPPTQNAVFHEYGISIDGAGTDFQVDYLINPQLGGIDDVRNLWPQPYTSEWNARAKDTLERRLHQMVCEQKIELADAQREIAANWIDAYKKYFHTSKPI